MSEITLSKLSPDRPQLRSIPPINIRLMPPPLSTPPHPLVPLNHIILFHPYPVTPSFLARNARNQIESPRNKNVRATSEYTHRIAVYY
jgi:hypothetical protein